MRFRFSFILILFWLASAGSLHAQEIPVFYFKQITLQQGLSESTVRDIIEDKRGYMWFGTEEGLNKYDGNKFTIYKNERDNAFSITSNFPKVLYNDRSGNLWVLTRRGVNIYNHIADNFHNANTHTLKALEGMKGDAEAIIQGKDGVIWIASDGGVLYKITSLDLPPVKFVHEDKGRMRLFLSLTLDESGNIYIGTRNGLLSFDPATGRFTELDDVCGRGSEVNDLFYSKDHVLWIGSNKGLISYEPASGKSKKYAHDENDPSSILGHLIRKIIAYKDGNLLVAIDGSGIDYFDLIHDKFYHYTQENNSQLNCNNITSLYLDSKNDLWAGTYLNGINFSNASTNLFVFTSNNFHSATNIKRGIITNFTRDSAGNMWVATDGGGLFLKRKGDEQFCNFKAGKDGLSSNVLICLCYHDGDIWITTYDGGLNRFNIKTQKNTIYNHNLNDSTSIAGDRLGPMVVYHGKLWIAVDNFGVDEMDMQTGKFIHHPAEWNDPHSLPSGWIISLLKDSKDKLWLGTAEGLCMYDEKNSNFKNFNFSEDEYNKDRNYISDMIEDEKGRLWVGTSGGGVIRLENDRSKYRIYTTAHGLSNNNIRIICKDNYGKIWLGTINGITCFDPEKGTGIPYSFKDGVTNSSFYYRAKYNSDDGKIYFGTSKGFETIDPFMARVNMRIPQVVLTRIKILNQELVPGKKSSILARHADYQKQIVLNYNENVLSLEFAALNYNNPDKNKFTYMLEGFDSKWSKPDYQNYAHYTNLNPGVYTFKVKGSNNDEVWNPRYAMLKIEIKPPYWKTWWFYLLEVILFSGALLLVYFRRVKHVHHKNKELEELIRKRTKELKESNEQLEAFVYKASHDIKGPLRSIIGLTNIGMQDVKDPAAISYFEHILKSTEKLDKLLLELLELTKVNQSVVKKEKLNIAELTAEALASFQHLKNYSLMTFKVDINQIEDFYSDKNLFYSIIQNLIENPIKYLDAEKKEHYLHISLIENEKGIILKFDDNGIGIDKELVEKSFDMFFKVNAGSEGTGLGLYLVKTAVEKLDGKISVESQLGQGSVFTVHLPKK